MLKPGSRHGLIDLISSYDTTNFACAQHSQAYEIVPYNLVNRALDLVNRAHDLVNRALDLVNRAHDLL